MDEKYLGALAVQWSTHTPIGRLAHDEAAQALSWLIDGGFVKLTGKPLTVVRQQPHPVGRRTDGSPIYAAGADFCPTETVEMS